MSDDGFVREADNDAFDDESFDAAAAGILSKTARPQTGGRTRPNSSAPPPQNKPRARSASFIQQHQQKLEEKENERFEFIVRARKEVQMSMLSKMADLNGWSKSLGISSPIDFSNIRIQACCRVTFTKATNFSRTCHYPL